MSYRRHLGAVDFDAAADRSWGTWNWSTDPCEPPPPWVLSIAPWTPPADCLDDEDDSDEPIDIGYEEVVEVTGDVPREQGSALPWLLLLGAAWLLSD